MHLLSRDIWKVLISVITFCVVTVSQSSSQEINIGIDAYEQGDYAVALENFLPFADIDTDYTQLRISENNPITAPLAQYYLGLMYCQGKGVIRDRVKALMWFDKSRRGGNLLAKNTTCKK